MAASNVRAWSVSTIGFAALAGADATTFDLQNVGTINNGRETRTSLRATVSGTSLSLDRTCPGAASAGSVSYTATSSSLKLYSTIIGRVEVYTRQP